MITNRKKVFKRKDKDLSLINDKFVYAQTMEILLTKRCNFSCIHCLRGNAEAEDINEEVLDSIFSKFDYIESLSLGGGEIALKPELVDLVYKSLLKNKVMIGDMNFTTNGTIVSEELLENLSNLKSYIQDCRKKDTINKYTSAPLHVCFSVDDYHLAELKDRGLSLRHIIRNAVKYRRKLGSNSVVFRNSSDISLIDIGRAQNLKTPVKVPFVEKDMVYPIYLGSKTSIIGGILCFSTNGDMIPVNSPFELEKELKFGNICKQTICDILKNMNTKQCSIVSLNSEYRKMIKKMSNSKKQIRKYFKVDGNRKLNVIQDLIDQEEYIYSLSIANEK